MSDISPVEPGPGSVAPKQSYDFDALFPADFCRATLAELNAWTTVADVAAAARCLADAPKPSDCFDRRLILPFPDDDAFEAVVIKAIAWFIDAFRTPTAKISLAALEELALTAERACELASLRFQPNGQIGPPGAITAIAPGLKEYLNGRFLLLEDEPHVIEVVQAPLRCLMALIHKCAEDAQRAAKIKKGAREKSGGKPLIYHKSYADSPLPAVIEAMCFFVYRLDFGPVFSKAGDSNVEYGYRAINMLCAPPIDRRFIDIVADMNRKMLDDLR